MCRLLYLPRKVCRDVRILRPWLKALELSMGGHGNGLATIPLGVVKGTALSAKHSARYISRLKAAVVWHSRRASCGTVIDDLCHPFQTKTEGEIGWLVHNGHWSKGHFAARLLQGDWTDSKVAALHITLHGWDDFCKHCERGVWIHLTKQGRQVHYASGSLYVEIETGALCSEPCKDWGRWLSAATGTYDVDEEVAAKESRKKVKGSDNFDRYLKDTTVSEPIRGTLFETVPTRLQAPAWTYRQTLAKFNFPGRNDWDESPLEEGDEK